MVLGSLVHLLIGLRAARAWRRCIARGGQLHRDHAALWPLLLLPITFWALAITWLVAALGAFLRDLNEVMLALTQILMYASAVFYSLAGMAANKNVPPALRQLIQLNPLAYLSEASRRLVVWGQPMEWVAYGWVTARV